MATYRLLFLALAFLVQQLLVSNVVAQSNAREVRVGVYQNPPQVFIDENGVAKGIYVDILNEVARLEGWRITYVEDSFAAGLEAVQRGDIDILTSIAATPERQQLMDFSQETIVSVWAQLYVAPGFAPENVFDLDQKTFAVMRSGILGKKFETLCTDFQVACQILPVESYDHALQAVHDGQADGAVVNSILGFSREGRYNAVRSSIVFSPFRLQVALPKNQNQDLATAIDGHLNTWRKDKNSFYFQTLDRWLGVKPQETTAVPMWVWWLLLGGAGSIILFVIWNITLRTEVKQRTQAEHELAQSTAKLRASEEKYRAIFEASKVGLALCKMDGSLVECNQAYLDMIDYTDAEARALTYWDITPRSFESQEAQQLQSMEETGGYGPYEKYYIRKDGSHIPVLLNGTKIKGSDGEDYIWSIVQDITERKSIEDELQRSKEAAEFANKAKSEFLSSMSHELRTPLNAVLGFAQILELNQNPKLSDKQTKAVAQIRKGGEHLLYLIDEILNLAKIETGRMDLAIEPIETQAVLDECIAIAEKLPNTPHVTIDAKDFTNAVVLADRIRLKQVLLNLISNAVKYNRAGGSVTISSAVSADNMLSISVTDTGLGIPANKQKDLFQPFSRLGAENSTIEGTGIGLTIARHLQAAMDGRIGFESTEGVGSTFWIELPLSTEASADTEAPAQQEKGIESAISGKILYIEDNPANVALMEVVLDDMTGVSLTTTHTAELGLAAALKDLPDLILMDINLPGMNGIEAMKELRRQDATRHIPVIAISADAMPSEIEFAMQAGFLDYLTKPFNVAELVSTISDVLSGRKKVS